jgi:hypothetical protein
MDGGGRFEALHSKRGRWPWAVAAGAGMAAAALIAVIATSAGPSARPPDAPDDTAADFAFEGGPAFRVLVAHGEHAAAVSDGARLGAGDWVRFVVTPGRYRYLLVASVDGAGRATVYFPSGGETSGPVPPGGEVALLQAVALDWTPGPERIFALFSEQPLEARALTDELARVGRGGAEAIRGTRRLSVGPAFQDSLLIEK